MTSQVSFGSKSLDPINQPPRPTFSPNWISMLMLMLMSISMSATMSISMSATLSLPCRPACPNPCQPLVFLFFCRPPCLMSVTMSATLSTSMSANVFFVGHHFGHLVDHLGHCVKYKKSPPLQNISPYSMGNYFTPSWVLFYTFTF